MKYFLVIIGGGNIGSRYLQGLAKCRTDLDITVVDPSPQALRLAEERWREAEGPKTTHRVTFRQTPYPLRESLDLAIVSTSADIRLNVIENLANHKRIRYWVLEKVLTQSPCHLDTMMESLTKAEGAWVNTSRRMMAWHRSIYDQLSVNDTLSVHVSDSLWGLASNAIHFIDLTMWWARENLCKIDISQLNTNWIQSERSGFHELSGVLKANFSGGSILTLEAHKDGEHLNLRVETDKGCWILDEFNSVATDRTGAKTPGRLENQSEITPRLIDSILETGQCELPTIEESIPIHKVFLQRMLDHWNFSKECNDETVPIT